MQLNVLYVLFIGYCVRMAECGGHDNVHIKVHVPQLFESASDDLGFYGKKSKKHVVIHKHEHKHHHKHDHGHKHGHKHEAKHHHEHKAKHSHKHEGKHEHKHGHNHAHKHEGKHEHKHEGKHQHKHEAKHGHKHNHHHKEEGHHKHEHKHKGKHDHHHKHEKGGHHHSSYIQAPYVVDDGYVGEFNEESQDYDSPSHQQQDYDAQYDRDNLENYDEEPVADFYNRAGSAPVHFGNLNHPLGSLFTL